MSNSQNDKRRSSKKRKNSKKNRFSVVASLIILVVALIIVVAMVLVAAVKHKKSADPESGKTQQTVEIGEENLSAENTEESTEDSEISAEIDANVEMPETVEGIWENDPRNPVIAKGVYLSGTAAGSEDVKDQICAMLDQGLINTVVIDIKDDIGRLSVNLDIPLAEEIDAETNCNFSGADAMASRIATYKEHGAYVVARIPALRDNLLASAHPECSLHWKEEHGGGSYVDSQDNMWLDPNNETVYQYLIDLSNVAIEMGADEIQFDYIRFPTTYIGRVETYGGTGYYLEDGETYNEEAAQFRKDTITTFVEKLYRELAPKGVFVSADVYGTIMNNPEDSGNVGQDYAAMAQWLDYICPMVYPSHYTNDVYDVAAPDTEPFKMVNSALQDSQELLAANEAANIHCAKVRPWLQAFTASWVDPHIDYGQEEMSAQIHAVYEAGYEEWMMWNASGGYGDYLTEVQ